MIKVSSSLHLSLQKAGQGEAMNFKNEKSKHFTACLLLCAHCGSWDNRGCCPCFHTQLSSRGCHSTWAPPWGCTLGCLAACCSSHPASLRWQPWLQSTAPGPSSPGGKGSTDGCTGPSVTISLQVTLLGSTWAARGAPGWYFCYLVLPSAGSSLRLWTGTVKPGHSALSLAFTKPCNCIPCTLLRRVSPPSIYLVGTHISSFCLLAYSLPRQPSALPSLHASQSEHSSTLLQAHCRQDDGLDAKRPFLTEDFTQLMKRCVFRNLFICMFDFNLYSSF